MGVEKLGKDLSLFNILQSISKLKATVYVLVGEREKLVDQIKGKYFDENTLNVSN